MVIPAHRLGAGGRAWTRRARPPLPLVGATVVPLDAAEARDVVRVGAKAANLAVALAARLPVIPGFAVPTTAVAGAGASGGFKNLPAERLDELHAAWRRLTEGGRVGLVTRSSAVAEDAEGSSMAGRFHSVLDVHGWRAFLGALDEVAASASVIALDGTDAFEVHDMGIVVQRFLPAVSGGVLFGADPVTGRVDRFSLATVAGGPDALVSGEASGAQQLLSRHGRVVETAGDASVAPGRARRRELAALARHAALVFGSPQDIEWAVDDAGRLWLLQSRPVTTLAAVASGPIFGPGPLAETFPDPLTRLEQDLWLEPMRIGLAHAIDMTGAIPAGRLASSPVAIAIGGRVAVDLELIGATPRRGSFARALDPRPGVRRLRAAWRTGRLRRAMPTLAGELVAGVDAELARVGALAALDDGGLLDVLHGTRRMLVALHGQEVLTGLLLHGSAAAGASGAAAGLADLARARRDGIDEARITARYPSVLGLVAPAIRPVTLPPAVTVAEPDTAASGVADDLIAELRESLRMRARWVQELAALAAWELGTRLQRRGALAAPDDVGLFTVEELEQTINGAAVTLEPQAASSAPLPTMFRLDGRGQPVAVEDREDGKERLGQGAGGGRRAGRVVLDLAEVPDDESVVLVTQTLSPALAATLPRLAGLVAETGSVLSHLAILAREMGVPTVVGVAGARVRFAAGDVVVVDGVSGTVDIVEKAV